MHQPNDFLICDGVLKKYYGASDRIVIPEGVVELGEGLFENRACAVHVTLPAGLKKIGARAFRYCGGLIHINIPDTVTEIGDEAFRDCDALPALTLPAGDIRIGKMAFRGCKKLADSQGFLILKGVLYNYYGEQTELVIPPQVTHIEPSAFAQWPYATKIRLPEGMTRIDDALFFFCQDLEELYIPESVKQIGKQAFRRCRSLADREGFVIIRDRLCAYFGSGGTVRVPEGITEIDEAACFGKESITALELPEGMTRIGGEAFRACQRMRELRLPGSLRRIGPQAFSYCTDLTSLTLPEGLAEIGEEAFAHCEKIAQLHIPGSVTAIRDGAFAKCRGLRSVTVPDSVTALGDGVFADCSNLEQLVLPAHIQKPDHGTLNRLENLSVLVAPGLPQEKLQSKPAKLAAAVGYLLYWERYEDPAVAESYQAFIRRNKRALLPILFRTDLAQGLARLLELGKLPVKDFDEKYLKPAMAAGANSCVALLMDWRNRNMPRENEADLFMEELLRDPYDAQTMRQLWSFKSLPDGTLRLSGYKGSDVHITFPARIGRKKVTVIGENILSKGLHRDAIRSLTFPEGITAIEDGAFCKCGQLQTVSLPASLQKLGQRAFSDCPGLADKQGFAVVGGVLFGYFGKAAEVVVPAQVRVIEKAAFYRCGSIRTLVLPETLQELREEAFRDCPLLEEVRVPGSVTRIGEYAFSGCEKLRTVTLEPGVKAIAAAAFSECEGLRTVRLPESLSAIGLWAFNCCNMMTVHAPEGSVAEQYAIKNGVATGKYEK